MENKFRIYWKIEVQYKFACTADLINAVHGDGENTIAEQNK